MLIKLFQISFLFLAFQLLACATPRNISQRNPDSVSGVTQVCPVGEKPEYPNPEFTPGVVNSETTKADVCTHGFTERERTGKLQGDNASGSGTSGPTEHSPGVSAGEKKLVFEKYFGSVPANPGDYEIDHFISLQLGGSNNIRNLWPQHYCPFPGAKEKDVVESKLKDWICDGSISMDEAQKIITNDWYACYKEIKANNKCSVPSDAHFMTVNDATEIQKYP